MSFALVGVTFAFIAKHATERGGGIQQAEHARDETPQRACIAATARTLPGELARPWRRLSRTLTLASDAELWEGA
jgi:hypothetical protein